MNFPKWLQQLWNTKIFNNKNLQYSKNYTNYSVFSWSPTLDATDNLVTTPAISTSCSNP